MIKWKNDYSVGYNLIDQQHKKLIEIINSIEELSNEASIENEDLFEGVSDLLSELLDYTETHFETEERALEASNYKYIEEHKRIHHQFFMKISGFLKDLVLDGDIVKISKGVHEYLSYWLLEHIQGADQKYRGLLNEDELY